jgi:LuxR family maltose regulon positive regulatory protein
MNLGITELWALRIVDARSHLEEALALVRRAERPYQEITCIAHLGLAAAFGGKTIPNGVELAEEAIAIAGAHGWRDDPVIAPALAIGGLELVWLGRFEEAERWLERAQQVLAPELEGMTEVMTQHAIGLVRFARAQLGEAVAALGAAEQLKARLSGDVTTIDPRSVLLQVHARMGDTAAAHAVLAELSDEERDRAAMRVGEAAVHLAEDSPEQALKVLAPVLEGPEDAARLRTDAIEALLFDAVARRELGDTGAAGQSVERALELAEPEGIVLPFALAPVRGLLERHPRHKTAHPTLLSEILDVLSGSSTRPRGDPAPLSEDLSEAELRVLRFLPSSLKAPEIAAELFVSPNTVRTHLRHIYSKLDAHSRREAVDRARGLGLLAPGSRSR